MFTYVLRVYANITDTIVMLALPYLLWKADPIIVNDSSQYYLWPKILYLLSFFVDRRTNRMIFAQFAASKGARFWVSPCMFLDSQGCINANAYSQRRSGNQVDALAIQHDF
jgi:hypothetical protein